MKLPSSKLAWRPNKNAVLLLIAIAFGIAASLLATRYLQSEVDRRTSTVETKTTKVVVPTQDLAPGDTISQAVISARDIPQDLVPADAILPEHYEEYVGRILRGPATRGVPLSTGMLEASFEHLSKIIAAGKVAFTFSVDDLNSISSMVVPGDHVDILLIASNDKTDVLLPVLSDVLVLATGLKTEGVNASVGKVDAAASYSNLTIEVTPADASRLAVAEKIGRLRISLRRAPAEDVIEFGRFTKEQLLKSGVGKGRERDIEFIIGGKNG
ncbi:Flp pilus assembly protein CpaB [Dyella solisilvae]|uniref:Flp pilus assembly protein CpaB n=1 Tax=Dyella solisilvae TaxID=1920168 RepID=A0A370K791_9GAMM|nr:Flp pilus assembly protein CpaB [Dyella solisilvae]RDI98529.1 Flp pilus assembly protein CpaB [Dyella solisilvae]